MKYELSLSSQSPGTWGLSLFEDSPGVVFAATSVDSSKRPGDHRKVENTERDFIRIFSDGACSGNPGPGGWGAIVLFQNNQVQELGGREASTTNNRMEMMAALESLRLVADQNLPVHFYTDSTYLIRGITQWIWGWKKRGWKTADGGDVSNRDIWEELSEVIRSRGAKAKIDWHYTRGHIGNPGNERCDRIAVAFSRNESVRLFQGPYNLYSVNLNELPADTSLPEMKAPGEKKEAAFSYLSNIGGLVYRHKDWPSCQKRVSGQSGAKFKKAKSANDELEILRSWGLGAQTVINEG